MASPDQVKQYLAYWFQLGKKVVVPNSRETLLPQPVLQGDRYSPEFEACWQRLSGPRNQDSYLEGTDQTIGELLTSAWDVNACARCDMPIPVLSLGARSPACPCEDLPSWPNTDLPQPRSPISTSAQLSNIRDRLRATQKTDPA
jgi:hypothetical protein